MDTKQTISSHPVFDDIFKMLDGEKEKRAEKKSIDSLLGPMIGMSVLGAATGFMLDQEMGRMNKMFGETNLKGVVKEMMSGAMEGIIDHFECKILELEGKVQVLEKKLELEEHEHSNDLERAKEYEKLWGVAVQDNALLEAKIKELRKKKMAKKLKCPNCGHTWKSKIIV